MRAYSENKSDYKSLAHTHTHTTPPIPKDTTKLRGKFIVRFSSKTIILWDLIECDRMVFVWLYCLSFSLSLLLHSSLRFALNFLNSLLLRRYQLALLKYQNVSSSDRFNVNKNSRCRIRSQHYNLKAIIRANGISAKSVHSQPLLTCRVNTSSKCTTRSCKNTQNSKITK